MIEILKNFFDWLFDIVSTVMQFLVSIITGMLQLFKTLPKILQLVTQSIGYLPSIFVAFVTITLSAYIIYLIVGRDPGDS